MHIDTEDVEGYNSLVKSHARQAPSLGADLLNARINLKADCGHVVRSATQSSVRNALAMGEAPGPRALERLPFGRRSAARWH
eukprot:3658040-Pyramimonas_sp.AAC.1